MAGAAIAWLRMIFRTKEKYDPLFSSIFSIEGLLEGGWQFVWRFLADLSVGYLSHDCICNVPIVATTDQHLTVTLHQMASNLVAGGAGGSGGFGGTGGGSFVGSFSRACYDFIYSVANRRTCRCGNRGDLGIGPLFNPYSSRRRTGSNNSCSSGERQRGGASKELYGIRTAGSAFGRCGRGFGRSCLRVPNRLGLIDRQRRLGKRQSNRHRQSRAVSLDRMSLSGFPPSCNDVCGG